MAALTIVGERYLSPHTVVVHSSGRARGCTLTLAHPTAALSENVSTLGHGRFIAECTAAGMAGVHAGSSAMQELSVKRLYIGNATMIPFRANSICVLVVGKVSQT